VESAEREDILSGGKEYKCRVVRHAHKHKDPGQDSKWIVVINNSSLSSVCPGLEIGIS